MEGWLDRLITEKRDLDMKCFSVITVITAVVPKKFVSISATILACTCLVLGDARAAGWFSAGIDDIQVSSSGSVTVLLTANHECGSNKLSLSTTSNSSTDDDVGRLSVLTALLAWREQGEPISFYITGCTSGTEATFNWVSG